MQKKHIALIVTGSVAAQKTFELVELLRAQDIDVTIVLTAAAQKWVTKTAAATVTGQTALTTTDHGNDPHAIEHMLRRVDAVMVAPASADVIKQLSHCDTPLAEAIQESKKPLFVTPAMNMMMWQHPATQRNVKKIMAEGAHMLGPVLGDLACGDHGYGRMSEPRQLTGAMREALDGKFTHPAFADITPALVAQPALPAIGRDMAEKKNKNILLMVQGGRDMFSTYALISSLRARGHNVTCALGEDARHELPKEGIASASNNLVYMRHYEHETDGMEHIRLSERADIVLVVPATGKGINEMAEGGAADFLSCTYLASKKPVVVVPSADPSHQAGSADLERLKQDGVTILSVPKSLPLAGKERAEAVADALEQLFQQQLKGMQVHGA